MSHTTGTNLEPTGASSGYSSLAYSGGNTKQPTMVLNPHEPCYAAFETAFNQGLLNPHQNEKRLHGAKYYSITDAYCSFCKTGKKKNGLEYEYDCATCGNNTPYSTSRVTGVLRTQPASATRAQPPSTGRVGV